MVTDRDIVTRAIADDAPGTTRIGDVMTRRVHYCFDDDDVHQATKVMMEYQVRRLPVLNRDNRLVGIVALADVALADLGRSEETTTARGALRGVSEPAAKERR
jgi:CBS domain-containing protein